MTVLHLLREVAERGGRLIAEGGSLKIRAPEPLPADLLRELRAHRDELLIAAKVPPPLSPDQAGVMIGRAFEAIDRRYAEGALSVLDEDADLARQFRLAADAIDRAVKTGPTEPDLRSALSRFAGVIEECVLRTRARRERVA